MKSQIRYRLMATVVVFGLVAAACGGDDDADAPAATEAPAATDAPAADDAPAATDAPAADDAPAATDAPAADDAPVEDMVDLSSVCPSPLVVQTDWFPEAEHGALYNLIGDDYTVDTGNKVVSGSMVVGGEDLGIDFEVRTGGPAIGFAPVASYMYTDDSIHLGYATTDAQMIRLEEAPLLTVVAPLEQNPQIIMWDPETYPDVKTLADLGTEGVTINIFAGGTFADVFVAQGLWSADQVDPSYDGSPSRFVSEGGGIAQQGFASAEPFTYLNEIEEWGKPVAFQTLHDAGFEVYSQTIGIKPADLDGLRPCLTEIVPIIQQSVIDYATSPASANAIIVDAVEKFEDFWVYNADLADFSIDKQVELGLVGNGPDGTVGNLDEARVQSVLDQVLAADIDVSADITLDQIFTNEFIDPSIGF